MSANTFQVTPENSAFSIYEDTYPTPILVCSSEREARQYLVDRIRNEQANIHAPN